MKTQLGITEKNRAAISEILNTWLADEYTLATKTKYFHWNVTGANFLALHEFFGQQYRQLDTFIDEIAERIRIVGHFAAGSMSDFLKMTHLTEKRADEMNANTMLEELLQDHQIVIRWLRTQESAIAEKYKDHGTADFITSMMKEHEKMAWMIRAHLG